MSKLGLASLINNESKFVEEWLYFHWYSGISKFYIVYQGGDDSLSKIKNLPFAKDINVYQPSEHCDAIKSYSFIMSQHSCDVEWMAFLSPNEFLFNKDGIDLGIILEDYKNCGGIIIPKTIFGIDSFVTSPKGLITESCVLSVEQIKSQITSIVKTSEYIGCSCPNFCDVSKPYVYQDKTQWNRYGLTDTYNLFNDHLSCNHYLRSMESLLFGDESEWPEKGTIVNDNATVYSSQLRRVFNIPSGTADEDNTVFISVGDYPNPNDLCYSLIRSAEKHGIEIIWASWGKKWRSFFESKIYKVLKELIYQKSIGKKYAFILDSCDVIIKSPIKNILDKFNLIYNGGVLFNCDYENTMYPCHDSTIHWYIKSNYGGNGFANAGCYCGKIDDILFFLEKIIDVRSCILTGRQSQFQDVQECLYKFQASDSFGRELANEDSTTRLIDDDQWLLHILQCEYTNLIQVDSHKRLFAMVNDFQSVQPKSVYDASSKGISHILHAPHVQKSMENSEWKSVVEKELC